MVNIMLKYNGVVYVMIPYDTFYNNYADLSASTHYYHYSDITLENL